MGEYSDSTSCETMAIGSCTSTLPPPPQKKCLSYFRGWYYTMWLEKFDYEWLQPPGGLDEISSLVASYRDNF